MDFYALWAVLTTPHTARPMVSEIKETCGPPFRRGQETFAERVGCAAEGMPPRPASILPKPPEKSCVPFFHGVASASRSPVANWIPAR